MRQHLGRGRNIGGIGIRSEHLFGPIETLREDGIDIVAKSLRPDGIVEEAAFGTRGDVGVDQRRAAQPAADEHAHVVVHADVVQAGARADDLIGQAHLHFGQRFEFGVGVFAGQEFFAAFQHGHLLAGACQSRSGDAAAVTRSDHDDGVVRLEFLDR